MQVKSIQIFLAEKVKTNLNAFLSVYCQYCRLKKKYPSGDPVPFLSIDTVSGYR
jgi:hypothetical protein